MNDLEQFLQEFRTKGLRKPSDATLTSYKFAVGGYLRYLEGVEPTAETHKSYVEHMANTRSQGRAHVIHNAVKSYHRWKHVPYTEMKVDLPHPSIDFLTKDEIRRLRYACRSSLERTVITVLYESALRSKELLGLRWKDVDVDKGFIRVTRKGGRTEDVPLFDASKDELRSYQDTVTHTSDMKVFAMDYFDLYKLTQSVAARAGLHFSPHDLRHARASHLRQDGVPLDRIQELLGHTNPAVTSMYYAHITPHDLQALPQGFATQ